MKKTPTLTRPDTSQVCKCPYMEELWELCSQAVPSRNVLRHLFTVLLQYAFSNPDYLADFNANLSCLQYTKENGLGTLNIGASSALDPGDTQNVPGIKVGIGESTYSKTAPDSVGGITLDTSGVAFLWRGETTVEVKCLHNDADICAYMQDFCQMFLCAQLRGMQTRYAHSWFLDFVPVSQTEPKMQKSEGDDTNYWYESLLKFKLDFNYSVYVALESKRLKDFSVYAAPAGGVE